MKEGWTYKKLGDVCSIYNGNSINAEYKKAHFVGAKQGLPFIATKDVSPNGSIDYNNGVRIPNYQEYKVAPAGAVFICAEGGSAGKKFGYVEQKVCFGNKLFCITPNDDDLIGKYIYYFAQSERFKNQFNSLMTGLIGGVSSKKFQSIEIPFPSISVQNCIISRLDSAFENIDQLKANAEKQFAEARTLFQKGLAKAMEPKEGWEEKILKEVTSSIGDGLHGTPMYSDDGDYFFVNGNNFEDGVIEIKDNTKRVSSDEYEKYKICLDESTVLLSINGTIGKTAFYNGEPIILGKSACYINVLPSLLKEFLRYFLLSDNFIEYAKHNSRQATIVNLGLKEIRTMPIPLPPLDVQQRIVERLDSLSENVRKYEEIQRQIISECDALKQALLRKVFE